MSEKAIYTNKPEPLHIETGYIGSKTCYTVAANAKELPDGKGWEADTNTFWEYPDRFDAKDAAEHPEKYLSYIPSWQLPAIQKQYTDAVQKWMDDTAHARGYDDIFTAISYADSSVPKFKAEGQACKDWRDKVWVSCYAYMDDVLAGKEPLVPVEDLIKRLPQIEWPE